MNRIVAVACLLVYGVALAPSVTAATRCDLKACVEGWWGGNDAALVANEKHWARGGVQSGVGELTVEASEFLDTCFFGSGEECRTDSEGWSFSGCRRLTAGTTVASTMSWVSVKSNGCSNGGGDSGSCKTTAEGCVITEVSPTHSDPEALPAFVLPSDLAR